MAIKINPKDKKVAEQAPVAESTNPFPYLTEELAAEVGKLPAEVQAKFSAATDLTPDLIDNVATDIDEGLMEGLVTLLEQRYAELAPAVEVQPATETMAQPAAPTDAANRKAARDALKSQIASQAKTPTTVPAQAEPPVIGQAVIDQAPTTPEPVGAWANLFPVNVPVTIVNLGGGHFSVSVGGKLPAAAKVQAEASASNGKEPKEKKVKVSSISANPDYWTAEYKQFMVDMKEKYPNLEDRIAYAQSLGLVRGTDWADKTKAGEPQHTAIENMYVMSAIKAKLGIEQYLPEARTTEQRKAIALGQQQAAAQ